MRPTQRPPTAMPCWRLCGLGLQLVRPRGPLRLRVWPRAKPPPPAWQCCTHPVMSPPAPCSHPLRQSVRTWRASSLTLGCPSRMPALHMACLSPPRLSPLLRRPRPRQRPRRATSSRGSSSGQALPLRHRPVPKPMHPPVPAHPPALSTAQVLMACHMRFALVVSVTGIDRARCRTLPRTVSPTWGYASTVRSTSLPVQYT